MFVATLDAPERKGWGKQKSADSLDLFLLPLPGLVRRVDLEPGADAPGSLLLPLRSYWMSYQLSAAAPGREVDLTPSMFDDLCCQRLFSGPEGDELLRLYGE